MFKLHVKLTANLQQMHQSHFHSKNVYMIYKIYDGDDGIQAIST